MKKIIHFMISMIVASMLSATAQAERVNVVIVQDQDQNWLFRRVLAFDDQGAVNVSGRIVTRGFNARLSGHIDVAIYDSSGTLIVEKPVNYYPALLTQRLRHKGGLRFSAKFAGVVEAGSVIKVAFHPDPPFAVAGPIHKLTIAR
ncbi:MAG: hypothetical protein HPY82_09280 [Gammaproteobacteria bacterium]|nr:hypothetical protein [Gammaproteobacteria bacterium]